MGKKVTGKIHNIHGLKQTNFHFPKSSSLHTIVGREREVSEISEYLLSPKIRMVNIVGPPGLGKTTLSLEVGKHMRELYGYQVTFARCSNERSVSSIYKRLRISLGKYDYQFIHELYQEINSIQKSLLILDDVDYKSISKSDDFTEAFMSELRKWDNITVLATSRTEWGQTQYGMVIFTLKPLGLLASIKLLYAIYPYIPTDHAIVIAIHVQGVPALLEFIGHQLQAKLFTSDEMIRIIQEFETDPSKSTLYFSLVRKSLQKTEH